MRIFPPMKRHKHRGPAVAVSDYGYSTRVLRRCLTCGASFTTEQRGNWSLKQIQEAENHDSVEKRNA